MIRIVSYVTTNCDKIMATEPTPEAPQAVGMPITVQAQYIKDLSFENPNAPHIFAPAQAGPDITMGVNVLTKNVGPNTYEVLLALKLDAKLQGKTAFISELVYGGVFTLPAIQEDQMRLFLLVEAPRLLFPFARNILTTAVRDGGFPQVSINPIDFYALYLANKDKVGAMTTAGAA
jgi:preprotein translocase subunit SecB